MAAFAVVAAAATIPVPRVALAADSTRIVDATGTISLRVPSDWRDVDTNPTMSDAGEPRGRIIATPDQAELQATRRVPLVWATVVPAPADPDTWLSNNTLYSRCVRGEPEPFDNGNVLGTLVPWSDCGDRKGLFVQVAARSKRNRLSAVVVQLLLPRADDALVGQILQSIDVLPELEADADTDNVAPVVLGGEPVAAFIIDVVPAGLARVVDDTHGLAVSVPPEFDDTHTVNELNDDGSQRPMVIAAPDLTEFLRDGEAGVLATRLPYVDPAVLLTNTAYSFCSDTGFRTVSNGSYKGLVRMWVQCDGPMERVASVALVPRDQSATVLIQVALPDDDLTVLQLAIASIELL